MRIKTCLLLLSFVSAAYLSVGQTDTLSILPTRQKLTEENLKKVFSGEQEIVSASRSAKKVEDLPVTVYIVTREEIIRNNYITLVDVLKSLPGIRVSQPGSGDRGETFLMRGLEGNAYAKILIDGIPIKPSVVRGMPISAQIPVRQAERIEITYGPASSIYGADAMSGVINIVMQKVSKTSFAQADASSGSHGYSYFNFMVGGRAGKNKKVFDYTVFGSRYSWNNMNIRSNKDGVYKPLSNFQYIPADSLASIGFPTNPAYIDYDTISTQELSSALFGLLPGNYHGTLNAADSANMGEESSMLGINLSYKNFTLSFINMTRQAHSSIGQSPYYFNFDNPLNFWGESIQKATLGYSNTFGNLHSASNLTYNAYRVKDRSSKGVTYLRNTDDVYFYSASDDFLAEQTFTWSKNKKFEVIVGGSFQVSGNLPPTNDLREPFNPTWYEPFATEISSSYVDTVFGDFGINPIVFTNSSLFAQLFWKWKKFTFISGFRNDWNSIYGNSSTPRFAVLWKFWKNNSFRMAAGSAFRAPSSATAYQSVAINNYYDEENWGVPISEYYNNKSYEVIPNADLKPEDFNSLEFGYRNFFEKASIDISFYMNQVSNVITGEYVHLDRSIYPTTDPEIELVRQFVNQTDIESTLFGLQTTVRFFKIIPSINLNADFNLHLAEGYEELPGEPEEASHQRISSYRQTPRVMGAVNVSAELFPNSYIRLTSRLMTPWKRQYGLSKEDYENPYTEIDGYFVTDLLFSYTFGKNLTCFINVKNLTDAEYGGLDVTGLDVDMHHNPQPGMNFRFGLTYTKN